MLSEIEDVKALLPRLFAPDYHELVKAHGVKNYILSVELTYRAAMVRTESRGFHLREDYPLRDDINWLKWVLLYRNHRDRVGARLLPIPIYRYPIQPPKLEQSLRPVTPPIIEA